MKLHMRLVSFAVTAALIIATTGLGLAGRLAATPHDPRATDANVTRLTTDILGRSQFAHHPLDAQLAGRLLDRYLDALDGTRSIFLETDVDEFAAFRATLAQATLAAGDTRAAHAIFARYLERLQQETDYDSDLLHGATFDFGGHDGYVYDRQKAPRPADLSAARAIWRQQLRAEYLQEKLGDKRPDQIVNSLVRRHQAQLAIMKGLHDDEVLEIYLNALAHVYDPHSDYLGHEQMESLSIAMNLSLFGIGATLENDDGYCKIRELVAGGPAARSGILKVGDRIVAVAQAGQSPVDIVNMPLTRTVELIRGPKGSRVSMTVMPAAPEGGGAPTTTVTLVRDAINLADQEAKARVVELPAAAGRTRRLGVIELPSFYANRDASTLGGQRTATADVARLLKKLEAESVQGIVMDLRHNGGGSLDEAISLTGLFIRSGPVVQTRDQAGRVEVGVDDDRRVLYDGPLVLLVSRFSASATEIMAGALQDYGRALVVGDTSTFGKGTVQSIVSLAPMMDRMGLYHAYDPGALKVTISKFYRPSGASTQLRGVASDIVLPSLTDVPTISESALKDPLPWDVLKPTSYERLDRVQPYLEALREASARRVHARRDFASLAADIDQSSRELASKTVSLNEAERRREQSAAKGRQAERGREARSAVGDGRVAYPITLANVETPGLPSQTAMATAASERASHASTADEEIILGESLRILSDYVEVLDLRRA